MSSFCSDWKEEERRDEAEGSWNAVASGLSSMREEEDGKGGRSEY